ncbi:2-oxoacid ferredoxin oxidoreductase [Slackia heliotrinireducens]|uniref:Indolepyruvate oxidoreductase subunit IorA n=1 Tax=Slackia heliotrinireducens (strain ATCC 29202 / DSM 20476 / NCTC 11029 / RHS 1) TaxID=471855 RepID=C7N633_SLAHD|nr:indolepyruvate ferredoxin oxidoreductase subunit alpha [Slackia heliotrinireducens]ACV22368.1 indolepyruvate ferredoxin oxidreductase, alpha/beta subunit [Slackia heliotrinireducens DSM 20476]VEH00649.1 2-oxoacid ferredoxin oxidoreductase [Slackia heliotrinireducens]
MELLSGNEAIARGAWEAGATIGVAYPGTPSTETMENFGKYEDVYAEWCTNEKVAVEVGMGASMAGRRVLSTMKHVGVNVAADPLFTAAYTGIGGGFVILAADDPGMHSSQNEQDSRYYAMAAHIPMLDPADSSEALKFTRDAYELSERFDTPVMIRSNVRVSHTRCLVEVGEKVPFEPKPYKKDASKYVMMPLYAKVRRVVLEQRVADMKAFVEECEYNKVVEGADNEIGVICAGSTYQHVIEALPEANVLKIGVSWPLPEKKIRDFAASVKDVYVIEEGSEYLSNQVKALGVTLSETVRPLKPEGELTPGLISYAFGKDIPSHIESPEDLPPRPPALCPGCPHRPVFRELHRIHAIVTGDIGCYTLGALAPLEGIDSVLDMGASVSMAHGVELALQDKAHNPVVAVIGDSTFAHSGASSLLNTVYNCGTGTVCILDNRTTAMTGRQGNPVNGVTLQGRPSRELDLPAFVRSMGVDDVRVVDPQDLEAVKRELGDATKNDHLTVIIFKSPCVLLERKQREKYWINANCRGCGICTTLGCPAISRDSESRLASIDPSLCCGCSQCSQLCPFDAIVHEGK